MVLSSQPEKPFHTPPTYFLIFNITLFSDVLFVIYKKKLSMNIISCLFPLQKYLINTNCNEDNISQN